MASIFDLHEQLERQKEVIQNIKESKENIIETTKTGRRLAERVSHDVINEDKEAWEMTGPFTRSDRPQNADRMAKEQRYQIFIVKMLELYKNEKSLGRKRNQGLANMEFAPL